MINCYSESVSTKTSLIFNLFIYIYIYIYGNWYTIILLAAGLDEIPRKYGRPDNSTTYCSDTANAVYNQNLDRWTKGCILPFPKKGDLGLAKNYRGITLTSIAAKNLQCPTTKQNRTQNRTTYLEKTKMASEEIDPRPSQILTIRRILEGVRAKEPTSDINICRLYQGFRLHSQRKDGTNPTKRTAIPKETVAAITILYRNTKVKVRSPDGGPEYFDIVAGVLQGDTPGSVSLYHLSRLRT